VHTLTGKLVPLLHAAAQQSGKDGLAYNDPARIINIGSVEGAGTMFTTHTAYAISKAGLNHMSGLLAGGLGREGINCNTLIVGPFATDSRSKHLRFCSLATDRLCSAGPGAPSLRR